MTYTTAGDTWLTEDNINDIKELLSKNKMENKNLKIKLIKDISDIDKIEKDFLNGNTYIIQIVSNKEHTFSEYCNLMNEIQKNLIKKIILYKLTYIILVTSKILKYIC